MQFILKLLVLTLAVLVTAYVLPGIGVDGFVTALVAAVLLALVNVFIRPLLVLLTLPVTIVTLGLFLLVINALLLELVDGLVAGFWVDGFGSALIGSIFISIINYGLGMLTRPARAR